MSINNLAKAQELLQDTVGVSEDEESTSSGGHLSEDDCEDNEETYKDDERKLKYIITYYFLI